MAWRLVKEHWSPEQRNMNPQSTPHTQAQSSLRPQVQGLEILDKDPGPCGPCTLHPTDYGPCLRDQQDIPGIAAVSVEHGALEVRIPAD